MNVRLFAAVTALGGGCIGVPLYLLQSGKTSGVTVQANKSSSNTVSRTTSNDISLEKKSIAKGTCTVIEMPPEIKDFFGEQYREEGDYALVSCTNAKVQDDYAPLPSGWKGWFPKFVFADKSKVTLGNKLEINTETKIDHDDWGISYTKITLSGSGLKKVYNARLNELSPKNLNEDVSTASVWDADLKGNKLIYFFVPKRTDSRE